VRVLCVQSLEDDGIGADDLGAVVMEELSSSFVATEESYAGIFVC